MNNPEKKRYEAADAAYQAWKKRHEGQDAWKSDEGSRLAKDRDDALSAWSEKGFAGDGDPVG